MKEEKRESEIVNDSDAQNDFNWCELRNKQKIKNCVRGTKSLVDTRIEVNSKTVADQAPSKEPMNFDN